MEELGEVGEAGGEAETQAVEEVSWAGPSLAAVAPRRFDVGGCWSREGWFWCWRAEEDGSTYKNHLIISSVFAL